LPSFPGSPEIQITTLSKWVAYARRSCSRQNVAIGNRLESEWELRMIVASIVRECGGDDPYLFQKVILENDSL